MSASGLITDTLETGGGATLRTLAWPVQEPVGRVQLIHGLSEHMGRYGLLAAALNRAGYSVYGHDHRGHGKSDGRRGVGASIPDLVADVRRLRDEADRLAPGPGDPFLVAHSLGGLVAIRTLQTLEPEEPCPWAGVVLSAPWLETAVKIPLLKRALLPLLRRIAPDLPIPQPLRPEKLTRDEEQALAYAHDPLVVRALSVSLYDEARRAQALALGQGLPASCPALLLSPQDDDLADAETAEAWAERNGIPVVRLAETRHEPFNEVNRNITFQRLVEWLDRGRTTAPQETP